MEIEHLYIGGEGGYQKIVQRGEKYIFISDESAMADFLDEEELKDVELHRETEYTSLEETVSKELSERRIKSLQDNDFLAIRVSNTLRDLLSKNNNKDICTS